MRAASAVTDNGESSMWPEIVITVVCRHGIFTGCALRVW